ncbi:hypothetical protein SRHO_G00230200 [Serrasalmus rhombeus]
MLPRVVTPAQVGTATQTLKGTGANWKPCRKICRRICSFGIAPHSCDFVQHMVESYNEDALLICEKISMINL